ncbi:hypothetical protein EON77_10840, partial [bacterium]
MSELLRTPHMVFTRDTKRQLIRVVRTPVPIASAGDYDRIVAALDRALPERERADLLLLADFRQVPMNNDPEFEKLMTRYLDTLFGAFQRRAVLVKTAVGMLHVGRTTREVGLSQTGENYVPGRLQAAAGPGGQLG